jgi:hypothetical protein
MDAGCPTHDNCLSSGTTCSTEGLGQSYSFSCGAQGVPGNDATYSQAMAAAAAAAGPQPPAGALCALSPTPSCMGAVYCGSSQGSTPNTYFLDTSDLPGGYCYTWTFASGGTSGSHTYESGHVYASLTQCGCPYSTDPTWD